MARSAMPPDLRDREGGGTTYSGATLHPVDDAGHLGGRWPVIILALIRVGFLAGRDLEQCQQEILARCGVALVQGLVVPAAFAVAAGRNAGLLDDMRPVLA